MSSSLIATRAAGLALFILLAGCSQQPLVFVNAPLIRTEPGSGYRFENLASAPEDDELFVALTFSGGGTRAAALAYGVLRELDRTRLADGRTLLDNVSVISSVSGGSFTALHYGLFGREGFEEFEESFLRADVERALVHRATKAIRTEDGRIGVAAAYYDEAIFKGRTYADLIALDRRPFLIVNASELAYGSRFDFTQAQFDPICSDLAKLNVAYAAAASSAVPGLFNPLTFRNYAGTCGFSEPPWVAAAFDNYLGNLSRYREGLEIRSFTGGSRPYVHLADGGVADNLGLRVLLDALDYADAEPGIRKRLESGKIKRLLLIVVNAASARASSPDLHARMSTLEMVHRAAGAPMTNVTVDTLDMLMSRTRSMNSGGAVIYPVVVAFHLLPDAESRRYFDAIGTNFALSSEQVDRLIEAGGQLVRTSSTLQQFLGDVRKP